MGYYSNGKRGSEDGVPIWRPKWWGELGNDAEYREAVKPRGVKLAYYEGGYRTMTDGVPIRLAAYVKDWAPWMKRALGRGTATAREEALVEAQTERLFANFVPSRMEGMAGCVTCRTEYRAECHGHPGECWKCEEARKHAGYAYSAEDYEAAKEAAE